MSVAVRWCRRQGEFKYLDIRSKFLKSTEKKVFVGLWYRRLLNPGSNPSENIFFGQLECFWRFKRM